MAEYISFQPKDYFGSKLYTGNNTTQSITGVGFQPDFTWIKARSYTEDHALFDAVRGGTKMIASNTTGAETTSVNNITSFDADGFSVGSTDAINDNAVTYASWSWRMGTTSGLTGGTITPSAYSISATAGQSVIAYTGTGATATIPHGLGAVPGCIIVKNLGATAEWQSYQQGIDATAPEDYTLQLSADGARFDTDTRWNDTAPTSSVFTVAGNDTVNGDTVAYIAYCFAPIKGYSAFGSYMGMGGADGPFIYTGFRPNWLMIKSFTNATRSWLVFDGKNKGYNVAGNCLLKADTTAVEDCSSFVDLLSNGFKIRSTDNPLNQDTSEFIYLAFAEFPIVSSNDVPGVAR